MPVWFITVGNHATAKDFSSSLCVQTGSGTHPASCTMGTGGPFPGVKARPKRDADHSPPSSTACMAVREASLFAVVVTIIISLVVIIIVSVEVCHLSPST
jgi:hypothetical protein